MNGIIFRVCLPVAISVLPIVPDVMSNRTQKDSGEEKSHSKIEADDEVGLAMHPAVLASTASVNPGNTKSESQKVPLSSLNVQQTSAGRPVLGASSSNYSKWNTDEKWSAQEWKSDELIDGSKNGKTC